MTNYVNRVGGEGTAHANTAGVQTTPATAALSSGGYVVVWSDANGDGSGNSIHAQRYDESGAKVGAELIVNSTTFSSQNVPVVIGLSSGGFAVAWVHQDPTGGDELGMSIRGRVIGADGVPLGADFLINTTAAGQQMAPALLALADGGFVASWHGPLAGGDNTEVVAQRFSAAGTKVGAEFQANTTVAGAQEYPSGSALEGGGYVLVWAQRAGAIGDGDDVRGQRFDADGNKVGAEFLLSTDDLNGQTSGRQYAPDVAGLPGGGFVAVWQSYNSALGRFEARAQIFDASGARVGAEFTPNNAANDVSNVSVAAFSWGGFVVAWDNAAMTSPSARAQLFDSDGSRLGDQVELNLGSLTLNPGLDIAVTTGGRLVGTWTDSAQDVKVQLFSAGLNGTAGSDNLTGGVNEDLIFGLGGDDVLGGGGGEDIIRGGDGADHLSGGAGIDTLTGGAGDDTYYVYAADSATFEDVIVEHADGGFDQIRTTMAVFSLAGLPEVESLFGISGIAFTLTGNDGDNYLIGNAAADTLEGGLGDDRLEGNGGADTMRGGVGDDEYQVDDIGDVVEENAGEGTDLVWTSLATYSLMGTEIENLFALTDIAHNFRGSSAANLIAGFDHNDTFLLQDGGEDEAIGGGGNDVFYFGTALSAGDVADGGEGRDSVVLQGNVTLTLSGTNLIDIESISLQSGARTTWGDTANNFYDYDLTTADGNVPAGIQLIVNGQSLRDGEDLTFDGSAETDGSFLVYAGHGVDTLEGGAGNDVFFFEGARFGASDAIDGGAGRDAVVISAGSGLNSYTFGAASFANIESISVSNRYTTDPTQKPSYALVLHNNNVTAGGNLIVNGSSLGSDQTFSVDGSAVTGGSLTVFGGAGADTLKGGAGNDILHGGSGQTAQDHLYGGAGADIFQFRASSESNMGIADYIHDFEAGLDKIDVHFIDADVGTAGDQAFSFIGSTAFSGKAGELRVVDMGNNQWVAMADTNGDAMPDYFVGITRTDSSPMIGTDFIL